MKSFILAVFAALLLLPEAHGQSTFFKKYPQVLSSCGYAVAVSSKGMIGFTGLQFDAAGGRSILQGGIDSSGNPVYSFNLNTGTNSNAPGGILDLPDGGFILISSLSGAGGKPDIVVTRTRKNGTLIWKRQIGTAEGETADRIASVTGGFILTGTTNVDGNTDVMAVKLSQSGAILWAKTYGDGEPEYAHSIAATPDGGAMISGLKDGSPFALRIDRAGNLVWARVLSISHPNVGRVNVARSGDAYYVAETGGGNGHNHGGPVEHTGIIVTRITPAGEVVWSRDYHLSQASVLWHLNGTSDGKIVLSGTTGSSLTRAFVIQLDATGKVLWKKRYTETYSAAFFSAEGPDQGIITIGCSGPSRTELFVLKMDLNGRLSGGCNKWANSPLSVSSRKDEVIAFFPQVKSLPLTATAPSLSLVSQPKRTIEVCSR